VRILILGASALTLFLAAFGNPARAAENVRSSQTEVIDVDSPRPRFDLITPGQVDYLRYKVVEGISEPIDTISIVLAIETEAGVPRLHITQRWTPANPSLSRKELDSWFEVETFRPLTHIRRTKKEGTTQTEGFLFSGNKVTGIGDLPSNSQANYLSESSEAPFNFETDLIFFQTLPWGPGYSAAIPFHHPGGLPGSRYVFSVTGSDQLVGPDGRPIDCWLVTSNYNVADYPVAKMWVAKQTQRVVKMVASMDGKTSIIKSILW